MILASIIHSLKIQDRFYEEIIARKKTFEVRKDDRDFDVGELIEFTTLDGKPREGKWEIIYKLTHEDFPEGIPEGYCILGIYPIHRIPDSRLFRIINGNEPTDDETIKILRSTLNHCKKKESIDKLTIYKASQGDTWWSAFKMLFWFMERWQ